MAEYVANAEQLVAVNQNVIFTDVAVCGNNSIIHRNNSGIITLRGLTSCGRARYKVTFGGNVAIPEGGVLDPILMAITINGEPVLSTTMISTPAAAQDYNNIGRSTYIEIPCGCCTTITVKNIGTQPIDIQNANIIVNKVDPK